ncbi:MAG: histidine--tRNA ligase [Planctomycetota bacterium]
MSQYKAPRGTEDLLPDRVPLLDHLCRTSAEVLERFGYLEIRTPLFEETRLFVRSLGEVTDVVEKEMFTCERGDTSVTFRPEATAGVVRAYLEHSLDKVRPFQKLYYIGPMFRFERPQAARQRQFHQVGVEAIGSRDPRLDAEVIHLAGSLLDAFGVQGYRICINSVGDRADRERYRQALHDYLAPRISTYCEDCRRRFERNVFRVLDCKVREDREQNRGAPAFLDALGPETRAHFESVQGALGALNREFEVDKGIIRGLDYYTHTVFELRLPSLGARDTLVGGGRYDDLVEELGGPSTPAIGFSLGVTGTLLAMEQQGLDAAHTGERPTDVVVAALADTDRDAAFVLVHEMRQAGLVCDVDYEGRSIKAQMRQAARRRARVVLIVGEDERSRGVVQVKDMQRSEQIELPWDIDLPTEVHRILESGARERDA